MLPVAGMEKEINGDFRYAYRRQVAAMECEYVQAKERER